MCSRSRTNATAAVLAALAAATMLAGCSDLYTDRRDSISLAAGEAMAANRVTLTVDPWSRASSNRNIAYYGERLQGAAARYRTHNVIRPVSPTSTEWKTEPPAPLTTEAVVTPGGSASKP